jgi:formylmethanofuran dehydrogenase subunit E
MLSESDLDLIREVHGHLCPMVILGARTAKMALRLKEGKEEGEEGEQGQVP